VRLAEGEGPAALLDTARHPLRSDAPAGLSAGAFVVKEAA
jgi:hypothetical protein